jgi:hypothetical protein
VAQKLRPDTAEIAFRVMQEATGVARKTAAPEERTDKNPDAVERGRKGGEKGGKKGGKARAARLTDEDRAKSATIAALVRWSRK